MSVQPISIIAMLFEPFVSTIISHEPIARLITGVHQGIRNYYLLTIVHPRQPLWKIVTRSCLLATTAIPHCLSTTNHT